MIYRTKISVRSKLLLGVGMLWTLPTVAQAQAAASADRATSAATADKAADAAVPADDIVVTGTRIVRDGYQAPSPTSVLGAQDIATKAPANIADYVNELPALAGSVTPRNNVPAISAGNSGINALNLRNLGVNRTLVLLDGQRVGPSSLAGYVDVNQFPQALIKRVDVVTGGASADWGSDAVAGVVNFVLDKEYKGLKGEAQGGVTTYGDDRRYKLSLTGGTTFADERGHLLISGEIEHSDGISGIGDRDWYNYSKIIVNPAYTATNGQPQLLARAGSGFATATPGGIITSGPLRGIYFDQGGAPRQFNYGPIVGGNVMQGGQYQYADFGKSGDLDPRQNRQYLFGYASYAITDNVEIFGQLSWGRATSYAAFGNQYNYGNIPIRNDNAFLPASIAAQMATLGITSFNLGTLNQDLGPITTYSRRRSLRPVIGIKGDFDAFGSNWSWDAYGQKSVTHSLVESNLSITPNYNAAIDSVRGPNGAIVCRSTLTNPNNGCVPYNIFGTGVNGQAAIDYVKGTAWLRTRLQEDVAAANLRGNPFSTWAGPVSVAMGIEHRREKVSGSNDPLSPARSYWAGNYLATQGAYHVTEGYLQTVVPLAEDLEFAKALDLLAGARLTNYSTSGSVTTWKVGLNYKPVDGVTFRLTRSRDIRAPNLAELFQANQTQTITLTDPQRNLANATVFQVTSGNLNLKPEKANSFGAGVVLQPAFLPGFAASVDYWNIDIDGAISTVVSQTLVNQCAAGNTQLCAQITRNAAGVITTVAIQPINLSKQVARGLDIEASYRRPLFGGTLRLRALATRYLKNVSDNGINRPVDLVGTNYGQTSSAISLPKWRYTASIAFDKDPVSLQLTARGFSAGVYNTSYIECRTNCPTSTADRTTIEENNLPGAIYFDANVNVKLGQGIETFLSVDNLANKDPAQVPWSTGGAPLSVNQALYDTLGRTFRAGVRFKI